VLIYVIRCDNLVSLQLGC